MEDYKKDSIVTEFPLVSIIIPVFNQEMYIEDCINSIISQSLCNFEAILVDDGSTDRTFEIVNRLVNGDCRFKIIAYSENKGTSQARKDAVLASVGRYVMFVDPDDTLHPDACKVACEAIKRADVDILQFGTNVVNCGVNYDAFERFKEHCIPYDGIINEKTLFFACFEEQVFNFNLWNKIYNGNMARLAFSRVKDGYYPKAQDMYAFVLMSYYSHTYASICDNLYNYYFGRGITGSRSIKLSRFNKISTQMLIIEQLFKFIDDEEPEDSQHLCDVIKGRGQMFFNEVFANYKWLENYEEEQLLGMQYILAGMTPAESADSYKNKEVYDAYFEALMSYIDDLYYKRNVDCADIVSQWLLDLITDGAFEPTVSCGQLYRETAPYASLAKEQKPIIPVVFATNDNYAPYLGVTLQSLIENSSCEYVYDIYVFHTTLSDFYQLRLKAMSKPNIYIRTFNVLPYVKSLRNYSHGHYSVEMYYRIVIPDVLKQYDKAVYLDCDMVLERDVADLYKIDLDDNILAAVINDIVSDYMISYLDTTLKLSTAEYFNSGVLVINNKAFISESIKDKCIEYLNTIERIQCPDQDILNLTCRGKVLLLGNEWNYQVGSGMYSAREMYLRDDLCIIHYTTGVKPWNSKEVDLSERFFKYARNCPFYEQILRSYLETTLKIETSGGLHHTSSVRRRNVINANHRKKSIFTWPFRMAGKFFNSLRTEGFGKTMHKVGIKMKYVFNRLLGRVDKYNNPIKRYSDTASPEPIKDFAYYDKIPIKNYPKELEKWYNERTGENMDIIAPVTFNHKIQWLKINDALLIKSHLSDKWLAKEYVKAKLGEEYIIKTLGVYDRFEDIDFSALPDKFVIKSTHGSGQIIIVKDKNTLDLEKTKIRVDRWLSTTYAFHCGFEMHYYNMVPRIIVEEYVESMKDDLYDYKFMCANGKVIFIWVDTGRYTKHRRNLYDIDWSLLPYKYHHENTDEPIPKPESLDLMISLSERLAKNFSLVRCDFYVLPDGSVKFGEMTFTSASGVDRWMPEVADNIFGEKLQLPNPTSFKKYKREEIVLLEKKFLKDLY